MNHHGELIKELRGEGEVTRLADRAGISEARWRQIELHGGGPAQTVYRMAVAVGAGPAQIESALRLAGFGDVYDGIAGIGSRRRPGIPESAELGVSGDPSLTPEAREKILDYIADQRRLAVIREDERGETEEA